MNTASEKNQSLAGIGFSLSAYVIWGVVPAYFKLLDSLPVVEIFAHRIFWSLLFTGVIVLCLGRLKNIKAILLNKNHLLLLIGSSLFIASNWIIFIWGSNNHHIIEVSLGYYINPLMNIIIGMIFFSERLRPLQWLAVIFAIMGIGVQVIMLGQLPLISLGLALAFCGYGMLRKMLPIHALDGLLIETLILVIPTLLYVMFFTEQVSLRPDNIDLSTGVLLFLSGPVTSIPLILFAAGVQRLRYSTIGFIQYIAPSIALVFAIFIFREPLVWQKGLTFIFIWAGLIVYTLDSLWRRKV